MVKLTKKKSKSSSTFKPPANWADAPVFVPVSVMLQGLTTIIILKL